jgi:hypothetical protein
MAHAQRECDCMVTQHGKPSQETTYQERREIRQYEIKMKEIDRDIEVARKAIRSKEIDRDVEVARQAVRSKELDIVLRKLKMSVHPAAHK